MPYRSLVWGRPCVNGATQVLAKSCKPIPVMLMGALMGKRYPFKKYINVAVITAGVAIFMGCGDKAKSSDGAGAQDGTMMAFGVLLLFISLCFDGGTGAYEDVLMRDVHVGPFTLMYNIHFGKVILAFIALLAFNEVRGLPSLPSAFLLPSLSAYLHGSCIPAASHSLRPCARSTIFFSCVFRRDPYFSFSVGGRPSCPRPCSCSCMSFDLCAADSQLEPRCCPTASLPLEPESVG